MVALSFASNSVDLARPVNWRHPLARGLVGWWLSLPQQWGGSVFRDLTDNPANGTLTGMDNVTDWQHVCPPNHNHSLKFDNAVDGYVTCGSPAKLKPTTEVTVAAWVYRTAALSNFQGVIVSPQNSNNGGYMLVGANGSVIRFYVRNGPWHIAESNAALPADQWVHLVGRMDGAEVSLWVDGVKQTTTASTAAIDYETPTTPFRIGQYSMSLFTWTGYIDDAMVWNRGLRDWEIPALRRESLAFYPGLLNRIEVPKFVSVQQQGNRRRRLLCAS